MEFLQELFVMDGQGKYIWFVLLVFLIITGLNCYLPYRTIKKIKEENSQYKGE